MAARTYNRKFCHKVNKLSNMVKLNSETTRHLLSAEWADTEHTVSRSQ